MTGSGLEHQTFRSQARRSKHCITTPPRRKSTPPRNTYNHNTNITPPLHINTPPHCTYKSSTTVHHTTSTHHSSTTLHRATQLYDTTAPHHTTSPYHSSTTPHIHYTVIHHTYIPQHLHATPQQLTYTSLHNTAPTEHHIYYRTTLTHLPTLPFHTTVPHHHAQTHPFHRKFVSKGGSGTPGYWFVNIENCLISYP